MIPVTEYIAQFPSEVQEALNRIRAIIFDTYPEADEGFAYQMPSYKCLGKPLVYFAAFKKHIGVYALSSGHEAFKEKLAGYKQGKGSVQFPLDQPIPFELIRELVAFRVAENTATGISR